jgi:hypothetical protein
MPQRETSSASELSVVLLGRAGIPEAHPYESQLSRHMRSGFWCWLDTAWIFGGHRLTQMSVVTLASAVIVLMRARGKQTACVWLVDSVCARDCSRVCARCRCMVSPEGFGAMTTALMRHAGGKVVAGGSRVCLP